MGCRYLIHDFSENIPLGTHVRTGDGFRFRRMIRIGATNDTLNGVIFREGIL